MGRTKYFPDTLLASPKEAGTAGVVATPYDSSLLREKSRVQQKWTSVGGTCYIQCVLDSLIKKLGKDEFRRRLLSVGEPEKDKVTVHFFWKGEPYDVIMDNTIITQGSDFAECSADVNLIMKGFMMAGLGVADDELASYRLENSLEPKTIDFAHTADGSSPVRTMQVLGTKLEQTADWKAEEELRDNTREISDIKKAMVDKFTAWLSDKSNIVTLSLTYLKGHTVTLKEVDMKTKYITYYDQMKKNYKEVSVSFDGLIENTGDQEAGLIEALCFKKDENGNYSSFENFDVRELKNIIRKRDIKCSYDIICERIRKDYSEKCNDELIKRYISEKPKNVRAKIGELSFRTGMYITSYCDNQYRLDQFIDASPNNKYSLRSYEYKKKFYNYLTEELEYYSKNYRKNAIDELEKRYIFDYGECLLHAGENDMPREIDKMMEVYKKRCGMSEGDFREVEELFRGIMTDYLDAYKKPTPDRLNKFWKSIGRETNFKEDISVSDYAIAVLDLWSFVENYTNESFVALTEKGESTPEYHYREIIVPSASDPRHEKFKHTKDHEVIRQEIAKKYKENQIEAVKKYIDENLKNFLDESETELSRHIDQFAQTKTDNDLQKRKEKTDALKNSVKEYISKFEKNEVEFSKDIELFLQDDRYTLSDELKNRAKQYMSRLSEQKGKWLKEKNLLEEYGKSVDLEVELKKFDTMLENYKDRTPEELSSSIANGLNTYINEKYKPYITSIKEGKIGTKHKTLLDDVGSAQDEPSQQAAMEKLYKFTSEHDKKLDEYDNKFEILKIIVDTKLDKNNLSIPADLRDELAKCHSELKIEKTKMFQWVTEKLQRSMEEFNIIAAEYIPKHGRRHPKEFNAIRSSISDYQELLQKNDATLQERVDGAAAIYKACRDYLSVHMIVKNPGTDHSTVSIDGQKTTEGRLRKQIVVKLLETFDDQSLWSEHPVFGMAQKRYKDYIQSEGKKYIDLDYKRLHESLASKIKAPVTADMSNAEKAYAEIDIAFKEHIKKVNAAKNDKIGRESKYSIQDKQKAAGRART